MSEQPRCGAPEPQHDPGKLDDQRRELEFAAESLADLIVVLDRDGCVVECDGASERVWAQTPAQVIGHQMPTSSGRLEVLDRDGNMTPPDAVPTAQALETGRPQRTPVLGIRRADGTLSWARVTAIPVSRRARVVSVWTDITAIIDHEATLAHMNVELERRVEERTSELRAMVTELEAFSYSVSHDLRTPARTISTLAGTLRDELGTPASTGVRGIVDRIELAAVRMDGLIGVLLELSSAARAEPQRMTIDISALARDELAQLSDRDARREVDCFVADGMSGFGDAQLIGIVLHNLLANAWKFTTLVEHAQVEVGVRQPDGLEHDRVFYVRDNGIGFDMLHAEDLFTPFRRLASARDFDGTGVGLAIVHRIVTRHGGRVWAESTPGEGATLFFTLPDVA